MENKIILLKLNDVRKVALAMIEVLHEKQGDEGNLTISLII